MTKNECYGQDIPVHGRLRKWDLFRGLCLTEDQKRFVTDYPFEGLYFRYSMKGPISEACC